MRRGGTARWLLAGGILLAGVMALGALTRVPYRAAPTDVALLRLSWRMRGELVEECRRRSAEELARLPAHMRREKVCDRRMVPYRLRLALDGRRIADEIVRASGAREDRPLYVFRERPVAPGPHRLRVSFEPHRPTGTSRSEGRARPPEGEAGAPLDLDTLVTLEAGAVALVTIDTEGGALVMRTPRNMGEMRR